MKASIATGILTALCGVNKEMKNMKLTALSAITLASLFATSAFAAQNEVSAGFTDLKDADDNFVGISYKRYLTDVSNDGGAYAINPYLQRVSSVNVNYFTVGDVKDYEVGGTWYVDDQWMVAADVGYTDYGSPFGDFDGKTADLRVGYNIDKHWQIGAALLYQRFEAEYQYIDSEDRFDGYSDDWTPSLFARYTDIQGGTRWDISTQYSFDDYDTAEVAARYFFNSGLSAGLTYSYADAPSGYDDSNVVELDVDYWVTKNFSVRFGLGTEVSGDSGLESATLLATYRF